jgi:hypothetical protein
MVLRLNYYGMIVGSIPIVVAQLLRPIVTASLTYAPSSRLISWAVFRPRGLIVDTPEPPKSMVELGPM